METKNGVPGELRCLFRVYTTDTSVFMNVMTIVKFILLLLPAASLHQFVDAQQWERLPLNGGHLDKLVQNPYNEQEIIGYIQGGDFFQSMDGGLSWDRIDESLAPFQRAYIDLTMDSRSRIFLMTAYNGLWRSSDGGMTWEALSVPGSGRYGGTSQTDITADGTIFVWESNTSYLYRSMEDGSTWEEMGPRDREYGRDVYIDSNGSKLILILREESVAITTDGGTNWIPYPIPARPSSPLFSLLRDRTEVFRFSAIAGNGGFYESRDTGKTWQEVTQKPIQVTQGDCNGLLVSERYLHRNDTVDVIHVCHTLHRSTDSGRTFTQITNFRVEDVIQVGSDLIASVPLRGIIRSIDYGDTWSPVSSMPTLFYFADIEFAHAQDDTLFALLYGEEFNGTTGRRLMESDDGGYTWRSLFFSNLAQDLFVDVGRPSRYYLHSRVPDDRYGDRVNRYSLITGVAGQIVPDTVLVTLSIPKLADRYPPPTFHCLPSERFPGWIYASRHTNSIGCSSDRGATWEWHTLPISISKVTPWPSQLDPRKILVDAYEADPMVLNSSAGLYLTTDCGTSFSNINKDADLGNFGAGRMFTTTDDRYFLNRPPDSTSTDYGLTWYRKRDGLDPSTNMMQNFQSHGEVVMETNAGMYVFRDEQWNLLKDMDGISVWSTAMHDMRKGKTIYIDIDERDLYVLIPLLGLYRIELGPITGIDIGELSSTMKPRLHISPNPARGRLTITWDGLSGNPNATIGIFDVLGRKVWEAPAMSASGAIAWACDRYDGTRAQPGIYMARLGTGRNIPTAKVIVIQ